MNSIVDSQRAFFNSNKTKAIDFRIRQLKKLKRLLVDNEALLNKAIYADFKKSAFENMMKLVENVVELVGLCFFFF